MNWHTKPANEVVESLESNISCGLESAQVEIKQENYGKNALGEKEAIPFIVRFLAQLKDFTIIILLVAAVISVVIAINSGDASAWIEPALITAVIVLSALLRVMQEVKAEEALEALWQMSSAQSRVLRDSQQLTVESRSLVPGDIVILDAGDFVPADGRIISCSALKCDESALTGKHEPAEKNAEALLDVTVPPFYRVNMVFSGSSVVEGHAEMVVTAIGMNTEVGKAASLLSGEDSSETPLQRHLSHLGKTLGFTALIICSVIFIIGLISKLDFLETLMTAAALAEAVTTAGLPAVATAVFAMGAKKMAEKNVIINRLESIEVLGRASVICSDKTATLTRNSMTAVKAWCPGGKSGIVSADSGKWSDGMTYLMEHAVLCCNGGVQGVDPTDAAIISAYISHGGTQSDLEQKYPREAELPFDPERKLMTTVSRMDGKLVAVTKGAPELLFPLCTGGDAAEAKQVSDSMGSLSMRVLAVARRELDFLPQDPESAEIEQGLTLLGLIGMTDPLREEAKDAIETCSRAGIRAVMISGDHITAASAAASELGILRDGDEAITGELLSQMSDEELERNVRKYSVYARVSPGDKTRIVKAWQSSGEAVAMTGNAAGDAEALREADIGCALGITGTSVAKGASDITLADDNFSTIANAVEEGRVIYDNIKKSIHFLISCSLGEVLTVFFAMLFWQVTPLTAVHLLIITLVTATLPALALGAEPAEADIMHRRPRRSDENFFAEAMGLRAVLHGVVIGALALMAFGIGYVPMHDLAVGRTMAFGVISFGMSLNSLNIRSRKSLIKIGVASNKPLLYAVGISSAVSLAVMFLLKGVLRLAALTPIQWLFIALLSIAPIIICELWKFIKTTFFRFSNIRI